MCAGAQTRQSTKNAPNFGEFRKGDVRKISLLRASINKLGIGGVGYSKHRKSGTDEDTKNGTDRGHTDAETNPEPCRDASGH
jgi:hypothetical protein